jgi:hypothetical protein
VGTTKARLLFIEFSLKYFIWFFFTHSFHLATLESLLPVLPEVAKTATLSLLNPALLAFSPRCFCCLAKEQFPLSK